MGTMENELKESWSRSTAIEAAKRYTTRRRFYDSEIAAYRYLMKHHRNDLNNIFKPKYKTKTDLI